MLTSPGFFLKEANLFRMNIKGNLRLVKRMSMYIQRVHAAIVACTFMKTLFTSAATANRTLMALIYTIESNQVTPPVCFFKEFLVSSGIYKYFTLTLCQTTEFYTGQN